MLLNFFLSSFTVAGISVIWRELRMRHGGIVKFLKQKLGFLSTALLCGTCFTYWTSFVYLLIFNPLKDWQLPLRYILPLSLMTLLHFLCSWMALAFLAIFFRFSFVLLKETVDHFTHHINPNPNHTHEHSH